jgi:hypothetical protein
VQTFLYALLQSFWFRNCGRVDVQSHVQAVVVAEHRQVEGNAA